MKIQIRLVKTEEHNNANNHKTTNNHRRRNNTIVLVIIILIILGMMTLMGIIGWESSTVTFWLGSSGHTMTTTTTTTTRGTAVAKKKNNTTTNRTITNNAKKANNCHFEDGKGSYEPKTNTANGQLVLTWNYNGTTTIPTTTNSNVISSETTVLESSSSCIYHNYLDELLTVSSPSTSSSTHHHNRVALGKPTIFVFIGDSLDRMTVQRLCKGEFFAMLPHVAAGNTAPSADQSSLACQQQQSLQLQTNYSSSDATIRNNNNTTTNTLTFGFFKIYGMVRDCSNRPYLQREDSRTTNSTVERLERFLLKQLPMLQQSQQSQQSSQPQQPQIVVMVGSALWDVSEGCNHQVGITKDYAQAYRQGILHIRQSLQKILPPSTIFLWRTNPQIGQSYSRTNEQHGWGRTRGNIETLNQILRETAPPEDILMDWWALSTRRTEQDGLGLLGDGRHPTETFSLVFANMVWNAVFSHYPELLIPSSSSSLDLRR